MNDISITATTARQILDSRGYPTIQVGLRLADGEVVHAAAPAGASTGAFEAVERRDGGHSFSGRSVHGAIASVNGEVSELLVSHDWGSLSELDHALSALDGTSNYARLGANAVVAVSIAASRAFARQDGLTLHRWISQVTGSTPLLPVPHFNVLNGGAHAANELDFQEFMIAPVGVANEDQAVQAGAEIYHALGKIIVGRFRSTGLGDEGGFAPPISRAQDALDLLIEAIQDAGYTPGVNQIAIALDPAANGFYRGSGEYVLGGSTISRSTMIKYYLSLLDAYPIRSIEDGFSEEDHDGWKQLYDQVGDRIQLVGDDLYVTDAERIRAGAKNHYSNAALIKPNQIGTISQTFEAIAAAKSVGMQSMVSHRSGETLDSFIADLAVGTGVGQIKSGAPARGERVAKYNRLTEIEADSPSVRYGLH